MKVINIIGHSNSGKTTLIRKLIPLLAEIGKTGAVKHMGHHCIELPDGKDTTVHYEAGAAMGAGIDAEKTVLTLQGTDVYTILDIYAYLGFDYCVIEGFKEEGFACAVLGDLEAKNILARNPTAEELFRLRDSFPDYVPRHHV
ncbi:MAG TPA: molybdopterin-guanine dinucleotide biosynthesis protein B [Methanocorpusculum sp.]|nr:molybdopterin-guanine dinucleotide biosynthesis protein B [Methanocorpusculum sp.]